MGMENYPQQTMHYWTVEFLRRDTGVRSQKKVAAFGFSQAVTFADDRLRRQGLDPRNYTVVKIERGKVCK